MLDSIHIDNVMVTVRDFSLMNVVRHFLKYKLCANIRLVIACIDLSY